MISDEIDGYLNKSGFNSAVAYFVLVDCADYIALIDIYPPFLQGSTRVGASSLKHAFRDASWTVTEGRNCVVHINILWQNLWATGPTATKSRTGMKAEPVSVASARKLKNLVEKLR
jgi:hypothetical protein